MMTVRELQKVIDDKNIEGVQFRVLHASTFGINVVAYILDDVTLMRNFPNDNKLDELLSKFIAHVVAVRNSLAVAHAAFTDHDRDDAPAFRAYVHRTARKLAGAVVLGAANEQRDALITSLIDIVKRSETPNEESLVR